MVGISRNAEAIREARVHLQLGSCSQLAYPDSHFDKVFAINSAQFWKDGPKVFAEIGRVLKPGGWLALVVQPRSKDATDVTHAAPPFIILICPVLRLPGRKLETEELIEKLGARWAR